MVARFIARTPDPMQDVRVTTTNVPYQEMYYCGLCGTYVEWVGDSRSEVIAAVDVWRHEHFRKHKAHDELPLWERIFRGFEP